MVAEKIAIAPMLDWTDRHYRYFMRQITRQTTLYSEMIVADAIIHGDRDKLLEFSAAETPLVLQLGGSDLLKLAKAAQLALPYAYSEINLNCGCPSDRVQAGSFGASLMREPGLVCDCLAAIQEVVPIPVTIKHRIGLDYAYDYDYLAKFVAAISSHGVRKFIVHARNAVLKGLSPKENREIPPLQYDFVYRLKEDFPELEIMINGGIKTLSEIDEHLTHVDSVMLGREAYYNPYLFATVDQCYYGADAEPLTRKQIAIAMLDYLQAILEQGGKLHRVTRHMIGLYHGCKHAKLWRQQLTTNIIKSNSLADYIKLVDYMEE
jgi:tRNA-dihydrouridine synthase A